MTTEESMKEYKDWVFKMSSYKMALTIIGIDKMTVAVERFMKSPMVRGVRGLFGGGKDD